MDGRHPSLGGIDGAAVPGGDTVSYGPIWDAGAQPWDVGADFGGGGGLSALSSAIIFYFYSLKRECEKLATEKTEIQGHYGGVRENFLCIAGV